MWSHGRHADGRPAVSCPVSCPVSSQSEACWEKHLSPKTAVHAPNKLSCSHKTSTNLLTGPLTLHSPLLMLLSVLPLYLLSWCYHRKMLSKFCRMCTIVNLFSHPITSARTSENVISITSLSVVRQPANGLYAMQTEADPPQDSGWWMEAFIWAINICSSILSSYLTMTWRFPLNRMPADWIADTYVSPSAGFNLLETRKHHALFSKHDLTVIMMYWARQRNWKVLQTCILFKKCI